MTTVAEATIMTCKRLTKGLCRGAVSEEYLIHQQQQHRGAPTTASSLVGVQVEEDVEDNKNEKVAIMCDVLRCSMGY